MTSTTTAVRFTKVVEYRAADVTISFVPTTHVPGFSHRVNVIDNRARQLLAQDWLAEGFSITEKAAQYFYHKHIG